MTSRSVRRWTRAGYLAFLALVLLAPFEFRLEPAYWLERLRAVSHLALAPGDAVDAARNVALFAGWGLLWFTTARRVRGRSSREAARRTVLAALGTAAAAGVAAELLQLGLPERTPSLLDAAMNALGGAAGAASGAAVATRLRRARGRRSFLGVPASVLAAPYLAAVLLEAAFPLLRHAGPPGRHGGPAGRIAWTVDHFEWTSLTVLPPLEFVLFVPAGLLCAIALWEAGLERASSVRRTALAGLGIALLGEAAHAALARPFELGPVLVHGAGFAVGGWLITTRVFVRWLRGAGAARRALAFLAAYLAVLVLWSWRPFAPELDPARWMELLEAGRWLPLWALGSHRTLVSVVDVLRGFLLFVPVGAVLSVRPLARSGPLAGLRPAVYAALALELGQTVIGGRFFDVTDPIVALAGAAIAWTLVRKAWGPIHPQRPAGARSGGD